MARLSRIVLPDYPHHITQRGVRSMNIFYNKDDYKEYLQILKEQCAKQAVSILSYCLMTNHIHLIVVPKDKKSLSTAIGETHRLYTRYINFKQGVKGHLFQERFFSTPLGDSHFISCLKYIEQNPVRAKMVKKAWDYPYSSARYRVGLEEKSELLSSNDMIDMIDNYYDFLEDTRFDIDEIREKTRTGRPCGDDGFYDKVTSITGVNYRPKAGGRPKNAKN